MLLSARMRTRLICFCSLCPLCSDSDIVFAASLYVT